MNIKSFLYSSLFILSSSFAIAQQQEGFTDKTEAKNQMVNGLKEGKWIEYDTLIKHVVGLKDTTGYRLIVYKANKPFGIVKKFYVDGKLMDEIPYVNGRKNGMARSYWINGKLVAEIPYINDTINGVEKDYALENGVFYKEIPTKNNKINGIVKQYSNGKLWRETPYTDGIVNGVEKMYTLPNGKLSSETIYVNGKKKLEKIFDENGNEIKQ
jgi:antitoxin component YwqK of YwqJK toxin-antitoxin module